MLKQLSENFATSSMKLRTTQVVKLKYVTLLKNENYAT